MGILRHSVAAAWVALAMGIGSPVRADPAPEWKEPPRPWQDPGYDRPENAAQREELEFTDAFNHRLALPPSSLRLLKQHPHAYQHPETLPPTLLLGDLLFHAPLFLGPRAAYFGVSCASCHPGGAATLDIMIGRESDRPGNVDLLSDYFTPLAEDGIYAPRNVPSLRGVRFTAPYAHDGSKASVSDVIRGVVSREFAQPLRADWLNAVEMYLGELDFLPNAQLDPLGRLTAQASEAAHRGEALFHLPRAQLAGMACAHCHVPESFYTDHRAHPFHHGIGQHIITPEEGFDTPTLINTAETPPYFFDGSAPTLAAAVRQIDAQAKLGLTASEQADLTAFLEAVGAVDVPAAVPTTRERFESTLAYLVLLEQPYGATDAELWTLCLATVRHDLHGAVRLADAHARTEVEPAEKEFEAFVASPRARTPSAEGRAEVRRLRTRLLEAAARSGPSVKAGSAANP